MCCKKDLLYFLAGAAALSTVSHILIHFGGILPLTMWGFTLTLQLNNIIIAVSALLTLVLLYLAGVGKNACRYEPGHHHKEHEIKKSMK